MTQRELRAQGGEECDARAQVVAYLDGELTLDDARRFELHAARCSSCARDLTEQRRLLCALDLAFVRQPAAAAALPHNFSQLIAARARSDMSGMRDQGERRFALKICLALGAFSALLLGTTAPTAGGDAIGGVTVGIIKIVAQAFSDASSGAAVLLRAVGRQVSLDQQSGAPVLLILLAAALTLLPFLIINYHRARRGD